MNIIVKEITLLDVVIKEIDEKLTQVRFCDTKKANKQTKKYPSCLLKLDIQGKENAFAIKSTCCSSIEPECSSQYPHRATQKRQ